MPHRLHIPEAALKRARGAASARPSNDCFGSYPDEPGDGLHDRSQPESLNSATRGRSIPDLVCLWITN